MICVVHDIAQNKSYDSVVVADGGEIKKVQFTDVKITNQTAMMEGMLMVLFCWHLRSQGDRRRELNMKELSTGR